jgi:hypothetical protein
MIDDSQGIVVASVDARSGVYGNNAAIQRFGVSGDRVALDTSAPIVVPNCSESSIVFDRGLAFIACTTRAFSSPPGLSDAERMHLRLLVSDDQGRSWKPRELGVAGASPSISAEGGKLHLVFLSPRPVGPTYPRRVVRQMTSEDGGLTWSQPVDLLDVDQLVQYSIVRDTGRLVCAYSTLVERRTDWIPGWDNVTAAFNANIITRMHLAVSEDEGKSWKVTPLSADGNNADHCPRLAVVDGRLMFAFSRIFAPDRSFGGLYANVFYEDLGGIADVARRIGEGN